MSGSGAPLFQQIDGRGRRLAVLATRWHAEIADALLASALDAATAAGADVETARVSGAFELPVVAAAYAGRGDIDAVVCLGVVVRGGTPHFDYVCRAVTDGCTRVALDSGKPVGFGVLTLDTLEQAAERTGKGAEAVYAVLETLVVVAGPGPLTPS